MNLIYDGTSLHLTYQNHVYKIDLPPETASQFLSDVRFPCQKGGSFILSGYYCGGVIKYRHFCSIQVYGKNIFTRISMHDHWSGKTVNLEIKTPLA